MGYKLALGSNFTDEEKQEIVRRAISGENYNILSKVAGVSTRTITAWRRKWEHLYVDQDPAYTGASRLRTWRDEQGNYQAEWTKYKKDLEDSKKALQAVAESLKSEITPTKPIEFKKHVNEDLLSLYILTDYHIGMMAWEQEGGDNWDLNIAEQVLINWFHASINSAPDSKTAILCNLGDFLHYDGLDSITPSSGHILDADSRLPKVVSVGIKCIRSIIDRMLNKHEHVHVIMAEGNHDLSSSVWLRALMEVFYENEPRITVDNTHSPYYAYEFGDVSLFFHHGHKKRLNQISEVFAGMYRDIFGRTKFSYGHMGHLHHKEIKENSMMIIEQHQTLAAKDAYASRGGYLSQRSAPVITYHKNYGEVGRLTITPEMIK